MWRLYVLRPIPRRVRPSASVLPPGPHWSSPLSGRLDSRINSFEACSGFPRVAARTVAHRSLIDFCPWSFDAAVTDYASQVATQAYRQFLRLDFHQLSHHTFARHTPINPQILLVNVLMPQGGSKMGGARCGFRYVIKPGDDASYIDRHCRHHLLQMGLEQPAIAGAPCAKGPHALGDGALNAGPPR